MVRRLLDLLFFWKLRRVKFTLIVEMSLHSILTHLALLLSNIVVAANVLGGPREACHLVWHEQRLV